MADGLPAIARARWQRLDERVTSPPILGSGVPARSHDDAATRNGNLETKNAESPMCQAGRSMNFALLAVLLCALAIAGFAPERVLLFAIGIVAALAVAMVNPLIAATGAATAATIVVWRNGRVPGRIGGVLLWLGSVSYSLCLTHVTVGGKVVNLGRRFIEGTAAELALSLTALAVCLAFAQLFFWCIERPAIAWSRRRAYARGRETH